MRRLLPPFFLLLPLLAAGCFSERSFEMVPAQLVRMPAGQSLSTREWATRMHALAADKLPADRRDGVTTDQLKEGDVPLNVWQRFHLEPTELDSIFTNLHGIEQSAQVSSPPPVMENGHVKRTLWVGFQAVQVPVGKDQFLFGIMGTPEPDREIPGSFIILTHGLFGSLDGYDIENHAQALRRAGHHVLAIEMRGHGETRCEHPEYAITFGVRESGDLLATTDWLRATHGAMRVGLVCFSLTGYESLLTAWLDGRHAVEEFAGMPLLQELPAHRERAAFDAGMFVVSAPVGIMGVTKDFEHRYSALDGPVKASFQDRVAQRLHDYGDPAGFSMWDLSRAELMRSGLMAKPIEFDVAKPDFLRFIDMSADHWRVGAARMENVRVPLLVLSAANDPLATGQSVADLFALQGNPNIGVVLLKEGGHMGFSALSADYYYSLMVNFFDPKTAPRTE